MKVKHGFSYLRLLTVLFFLGLIVSCSAGLSQGDGSFLMFAFVCFIGLIVVRVIRFMYRD